MDDSIFIDSMLRGSLSHSILTYPPCITDVYILMFPMLLAWLHFIIGIVGGGLLIQLATVYVIYIDCICWRWCRICCTLLVVVIPGRGSIWENWKITRACVVWINVCWGNKLKHNIKSHNLEFFQSIYSDTFSLVSKTVCIIFKRWKKYLWQCYYLFVISHIPF